MAIEAIRSIPHAERIARVSVIQQTIPRERIRIQLGQNGKPTEMWGFVWLDGLPYCFRAWHSLINRRLPFLEDGLSGVQTNWGFIHAPYQPHRFTAPVFTEGVTEDDMAYIFKGLKVSSQNREIPRLFVDVLRKRERSYLRFQKLYSEDIAVRMAYSTAISITCDEKEHELSLPH